MNNNKSSIGDYVVVAGTAGFTNVNDGEVHDTAEMLRLGFTVDELTRCGWSAVSSACSCGRAALATPGND